MTLRRLLLLAIVIPLIGACSGPQASTDGAETDTDASNSEGQTRAAIARAETFDVSAYPVEAPEQAVEVSHQVPQRLMKGRAQEGVRQTVEGYRIQVFSAQDQKAAEDFRERVRQWWQKVQSDAPADLFRDDTPIVVEYTQPYYRVRLGAFAQREDAEEARAFVQEQYEGAFVARSTVTVIQ